MFKLASLFVDIQAPLKGLETQLATAHGHVRTATAAMAKTARAGADYGPGLARGYLASQAPTRTERLKQAAVGVARGQVVGYGASKLVNAGAGYGAFGLGKSSVDYGMGKVANLMIKPHVEPGSLAAMRRVIMAPLKLPAIIAKIGISILHAAAEMALYKWVKKMTGATTLQMVIGYGALRLGLMVAHRMLAAFARTGYELAMIPIRVSLAALKAGLHVATGLVKGAARTMGGLMMAPVHLAGSVLGMATSPLAMLAGGGGAAAAIGESVMAAAHLGETTSKIGYAFHDSSRIITAESERMADSFGVPKREFLEGASAIGLIGKASGYTEDKAAGLGAQMARLAKDASSFYDIPFSEALEKMEAGLVGEERPLRELGVLLSETAVSAQAMRMGFHALNGEYSEGEKVQARAALIMKGFSDAQGDLSRTSGSFMNKLREMGGRIQNLAAQIGGYLLPAATELAVTFATMGKDLAAAVGDKDSVFASWGAQLKAAVAWVGTLYRNAKDVKELAGALFTDIGKDFWSVLEAGLKNLGNYAKYFGEVLAFAIEKAIVTELHAALPSWMGVKAYKPPAREPVAPTIVKPDLVTGRDLAGRIEAIKAKDDVKAMYSTIGGWASKFGGDVSSGYAKALAAMVPTAAKGILPERPKKSTRLLSRRDKRAAEEANARKAAAARAARVKPKPTRKPKGPVKVTVGGGGLAAKVKKVTEKERKALEEALGEKDLSKLLVDPSGALHGAAVLKNGFGFEAKKFAERTKEVEPFKFESFGGSEFARKMQEEQFNKDPENDQVAAIKDNTKALADCTEALGKAAPAAMVA